MKLPLLNLNITRKTDIPKNDFYVLSGNPSSDRHLLALGDVINDDKGEKKTTNETMPIKRTSFEKLELAYTLDEVSNRCANFYALQVSGPGFDLIGNPKAIAVLRDFNFSVRLKLKIEEITRDMCISGNSFWEIIRNTKNDIVDLQRIDFKKIDYVRDTYGHVKEDASGIPEGYVFGLNIKNPVYFTDGKNGNNKREDILHFKLFSSGNELAVGYMEPCFKIIYLKLNVRDGLAQASYRIGHPLYIIYVGDPPNPKTTYPGHVPNSTMVGKIDDEFQNIETKHKFVMPYYTKVEELKPEAGLPQRELLDYCDSRISGCFGIPLELVIGEGKGNKATMEIAITRDLDRRIKSLQNKIAIEIESILYPQILKQNGIEVSKLQTPIMRWREITPADLNRKAKRITEYIDVGVLTPEDVREQIIIEEGIRLPSDRMKEIEQKGVETLAMDDLNIIGYLEMIKVSFPDSQIIMLIEELLAKMIKVNKLSLIESTPIDGKKFISVTEALFVMNYIRKNYKDKKIQGICSQLIELIKLKDLRNVEGRYD